MEFSCYDCQQVFPINQLSVCKRNKDEKRMEKLLKLLVCEKCAEKHEEICEESIHPKNARRLIVNATSNSIDDFFGNIYQ
ncbi:unnamed protein product, partial [Mesorhabditis belari]|uniref:Uncharacterized protein n=1 Tax=Mesorhabditis belari TaxID=2138241 RepID=A0AAF3ENK4_9BILA